VILPEQTYPDEMRGLVILGLLGLIAAGCSDQCETGGDGTIPTESQLARYGDAVIVADGAVLGEEFRAEFETGRYEARHATATLRRVVYLDPRLPASPSLLPAEGEPLSLAVADDRCARAAEQIGPPGETLVLFLMWTGREGLPDWEDPWYLAYAFLLGPGESLQAVGDPNLRPYLNEAIADAVPTYSALGRLGGLGAWLEVTRSSLDFDPRLP
jgi:hypothetical protein